MTRSMRSTVTGASAVPSCRRYSRPGTSGFSAQPEQARAESGWSMSGAFSTWLATSPRSRKSGRSSVTPTDRPARLDLRRRPRPGLDALHPRQLVGGREQQRVTLPQPAGLDAADAGSGADPTAVDVLDGEPQRRLSSAGGAAPNAIERLDQGRPLCTRAVGAERGTILSPSRAETGTHHRGREPELGEVGARSPAPARGSAPRRNRRGPSC